MSKAPVYKAPRTTQVPFIYPITIYAKKVQFKDKYVFVVGLNKQKYRIPYKDVVVIERLDKTKLRVTYQHRGHWSAIIGKTEPVRINKYLVRYDRKDQDPIYVRQKEDE